MHNPKLPNIRTVLLPTVTVLHWLSKHAGLTSECLSEVIEPFTRWWLGNTIHGTTWNEAAEHAATRQVIQPPPCPAKAVELNTASSSGEFEQYTLLAQLTDAEAQSKPLEMPWPSMSQQNL